MSNKHLISSLKALIAELETGTDIFFSTRPYLGETTKKYSEEEIKEHQKRKEKLSQRVSELAQEKLEANETKEMIQETLL